MSHLKKDFKFHNYFDNKFSEQTYLAYLCRDNKRYVIRSGDYIPRFIIDTIDFIIDVIMLLQDVVVFKMLLII